MIIKEIQAKSILRKHKKIDSWFISRYGMNLYRGCIHNCVYCDGRAEGYYVEGEFGEEVEVKVNAIELLRRELDPKGKRKPLKRAFVVVGGGVGDSYQPVERKYRLSRQVLELLEEYDFPVHILTKSTLVERDLDILQRINKKSRMMLSMSFSSVDERISTLLEPGVPSPQERLSTLAKFKEAGFACGMFLLPVIPFLTDTPQFVERAFKQAADIELDYMIFGGMTLKDGRQRDFFSKIVFQEYPQLEEAYREIYLGSKWGNARGEYYQALHESFETIANRYKIPQRIPARLYRDFLDENDLIVVILEQIDYFLQQQGQKSPYGYAAYSISQLKEPVSTLRNRLQTLKGVGKATEKIIIDILDTGSSAYYEELLRG